MNSPDIDSIEKLHKNRDIIGRKSVIKFVAPLFILANLIVVFGRGYFVHENVATEAELHGNELQAPRGALSPIESNEPDDDSRLQSSIRRGVAIMKAGLDEISRNVFKVGQIEIKGLIHLNRKEVLEALGWNGEAPYLWQALPGYVQYKISALPWTKAVQVSISLMPLSMKIALTESEPWIVAEYEHDSWLVDDQGKLVSNISMLGKKGDIVVQAASLPRLDGIDVPDESNGFLDSANSRLSHALNSVKIITEQKLVPFNVERYSLLSDGSLLLIPEMGSSNPELKMKVTCESDGERTSLLLKQVLADLAKRGERASSIDLRYENQIIVK